MQTWLPDEFVDGLPINSAPCPQWDKLPLAEGSSGDCANPADRFQKESRFVDPNSLLSNLTKDERALIFELAEQDVARQYEDRESELKAELEKNLAEAKSDYESRRETWSREFGEKISQRVSEELVNISKASAQLAVQLAGKITRSLVPLDQEILVRGIQTALFKIPGSQPIHLVVHPDDAGWLKEQQDLLGQLNITTVDGDRRLEPGGCLLQSGGREWDSTIAGQLETLGEVVQEAIATAGSEPTLSPSEDENDPGLE